MPQKFLITGATGYQGGAAARLLLAQNAIVHALVRDPTSAASQKLEKSGAILFKGDFDDVDAIKAATQDVSGVFINLSPTWPASDQIRHAHNLVDAAVAAKTVNTIVNSTAFNCGNRNIWAERDPSDGLYMYYSTKAAVEQTVRDAEVENYTIFRPAWLMHNYLLPQSVYHFPELSTEGVMAHVYHSETRMPHFDAEDVGKFVAAALLEPERFKGHEVDLGFENLTIEETGRFLSQALGREVPTRVRSEEEASRLYGTVGTLIFQELANKKDLSIDGTSLMEKYGIRFTTFEDYLKREKETLVASIPAKV